MHKNCFIVKLTSSIYTIQNCSFYAMAYPIWTPLQLRYNLSYLYICYMYLILFYFALQDDLKTQVNGMKRQLQEAIEQQTKSDAKLASATNSLRQLQEEKGSLESRLGQKSAQFASQVCNIYNI